MTINVHHVQTNQIVMIVQKHQINVQHVVVDIHQLELDVQIVP